MADFEQRLTKLEEAQRVIEDALLVQAQLEARLARTAKELAENAERDRARTEALDTRMKALDDRLEKLVIAMGEYISRISPPLPR